MGPILQTMEKMCIECIPVYHKWQNYALFEMMLFNTDGLHRLLCYAMLCYTETH